MSKNEQTIPSPIILHTSGQGSYHDHFARLTISDLEIMKDLLRYYIQKAIADIIDPERLRPLETALLTRDLKEIILDKAFIARFRDDVANSDLFVVAEHKSHPSKFLMLQLGTQVFVSLYAIWTQMGRPESESFQLPIPIMIVLYNGTEDWDTNDLYFQGIFGHIPLAICENVPQFRVIAINLNHFEYGKLPGSPETQAAIESLKRAKDGTFAENLAKIIKSLSSLPLDQRIEDLIRSIIVYAGWSGNATKAQLDEAAQIIWKGNEGIEMAETIQKSFVQECLEKCEAICEARGETKAIVKTLRFRFGNVPDDITTSLGAMSDPVALDSLMEHALGCDSLEDFADSL